MHKKALSRTGVSFHRQSFLSRHLHWLLKVLFITQEASSVAQILHVLAVG